MSSALLRRSRERRLAQPTAPMLVRPNAPFADLCVYAVQGNYPEQQVAPRNNQVASIITGALHKPMANGPSFGGGDGAYGSGAVGDGWQYGTANQSLFTGNQFALLVIVSDAASTTNHYYCGEYGYAGASSSSALLIGNLHQGASTSGAIQLSAYDAAWLYRISVSGGVLDGQPHCVMIARTGASTCWGAIDGKPLALTQGAETSNASNNANNRTVFAGIPPLSSSSFSARSPMGLGLGWNGLLPQDFGLEITAEPWAYLARRQRGRRIWVPVSAGTGADLTIPDSAHAHTSDNLALTTDSSLVIADATHGHTSEQVTLNTAAQLAVADAAHTHTSDATSLTTASSLTVANAAHAHTSEQISLTASGTPTLEVSDSAHAHTAEAVSLSAQLLLAVQDAAHAHTADNVVIELAGAELLRAPSRLVIASPQRQVSFTLGRVRRRIGHTLIPTE